MNSYEQIYIDGQFVTPHGHETLELINPSTGKARARVRLGDETDVRQAIAAARAAFASYSRTRLEKRAEILERLYEAVRARSEEHTQMMVEEYGGPLATCQASTQRAAGAFLHARDVMRSFPFERTIGSARVVLEPHGVVGIITPWNASSSFVCGKLAMALAAGSTAVIKPSELSAGQTQLLLECFHAAGVPNGLFNVVNGLGAVVGAEMVRHPDIAKISFTGSTTVGKAIARGAADTMKRVTLELGGKSPTVLLEDADLSQAIPVAMGVAYANNGQACIAGTRLLVPESRLEEVKALVTQAAAAVRVGDPARPETQVGPLVTSTQFERVQSYIRLGIEEGAELLVGGEGRPEGLEGGYFVRPTVFAGVRNTMRIAQEEIFGPVLSIMSYTDDEDAIRQANDTVYGLQAYVCGTDPERARRVADRLVAGRVFVNGFYDEPEVPFGGFKQSGLGREFGVFGLEGYLEPKAVVGV